MPLTYKGRVVARDLKVLREQHAVGVSRRIVINHAVVVHVLTREDSSAALESTVPSLQKHF